MKKKKKICSVSEICSVKVDVMNFERCVNTMLQNCKLGAKLHLMVIVPKINDKEG